MPATKVQLIGGVFQDNEGNVLALGYLKLRLSSDEQVAGVGQIAAGIVTTIKLNSAGSIDTSTPQLVWGNDQMTPLNNYYIVEGFTAAGELAWGPNNEQVIGSGGTFDVGTWIPNTVLSWFYPAQVGPTGPAGSNGTNGATGAAGAAGATAPNLGLALPGWWMCCDGSNYPFDGTNGLFTSGTANIAKFWMIRVPYTIVVKTMTFRFNGAGVGGVGGMAVYDATGQTKLVSFDNFAFSGGAGAKTITNSQGGAVAVTLPPAVYIVASAQSVTGAGATTQGGYKTQGSSDNTNGWNANATARSGVGTNLMVAGVMPSALGALSLSTNVQTSLPCCCFEPS